MKYLRLGFFAVGILLFIAVIRKARVADAAALAARFDWRLTLLAFISYIGVNIARVERISLMLGKKVSRQHLFPIVFIQNFFNVFLAFSGDVAYVSLLHGKKAVALGENFSSLVSGKALDLAALGATFFGAILLSGSPRLAAFQLPALLCLFLIVGTVGTAIFYPGALVRGATYGARALGIAERRIAIYAMKGVREVADGFLRLQHRDLVMKIVFSTIVNWAGTFLCGFFLLRGAGIGINASQTVFVYTLPIMVSLTPAFIFGGLGSFEAALVGGLVLVGFNSSAVIPASIAIHLEELVFVAVLGAVGFALHDGFRGYFSRGRRV